MTAGLCYVEELVCSLGYSFLGASANWRHSKEWQVMRYQASAYCVRGCFFTRVNHDEDAAGMDMGAY